MHEQLIRRLEAIVASQEYFARLARDELEKLRSGKSFDEFETLRSQAFIHAHVGMNDLAARQLNALASESRGQTPAILNKLAQVQLRRLQPGDAEAAVAAASLVLGMESASSGDLWFAHHNIGLAKFALGNREEAEAHATQALQFVDDPRTHELMSAIESARIHDISFIATMEAV